jgi:hypothetical protein
LKLTTQTIQRSRFVFDGLGNALAQFLDYGFCKVIVDFVVTRNGLGLLGLLVGVPIMPTTVTDEDASHVFKSLDQVTPFHLRDHQLFNLADVWHVTRFQINQQVLQVFGKLFLMHPLGLVVGVLIQVADKKLTVLPRCKFDCSHNQSPYGGNIKRFFVKSKGWAGYQDGYAIIYCVFFLAF